MKYEKHMKLKGVRVSLGLTHADMGKLINVKAGTYAQKENGRIPFVKEEIDKIKKYFGMPYEEIFDDEDN